MNQLPNQSFQDLSNQLCVIGFPKTNYDFITLKKNSQLSEHLTVQNSPVLFGCRTGICGTCLVLVEGDIPPSSLEEQEVLEILAPGNNRARLACQIALTNDIEIIPIGLKNDTNREGGRW